MRKLHDMLNIRLLLVLMALATVVSCSVDLSGGNYNDDGPTAEGGMLLSFAVPNTADARTKSIDAITQVEGEAYFHGMQGIRLLPFSVKRKIESSDARNGAIPQADALGQDTHQAQNYAFVYPNFPFVPIGTSSFLFYGYAADNTGAGSDVNSVAFKLLNGSLIAEGLDSRNPAGITFSPEQIWTSSENYPSESDAIANYLTQIANTSYTQTYYRQAITGGIDLTPRTMSIAWNWTSDSPDGGLLSIFNRFINRNGNSYSLIGISGRQAAALLTDLYQIMKDRPNSQSTTQYKDSNGRLCYTQPDDYENHPLTCAVIHDNLRNAIIDKIEGLANNNVIQISSTTSGGHTTYTITFNGNLQDCPRNHGLPDGTLGVRWDPDHTQFDIVAQGTKQAIRRYCYPPRLWYYANSQIQTSTTSDNLDQYPTQASRYNRWTEILSHYTSGPTVQQETQAVALIDPVQYGVALLSLTLNQTAATLPDAAGDAVTVGSSSFPLTGLFVAGQRPQNFAFTPIQPGQNEDNEHVSYDRYPGNSTIYLNEGSGTTGPVRTLVLQTLPGEDIYIAVEFENNSGVAFLGLDGIVIPGGRFYLTGQLVFASGSSLSGSFNSVFQQDHVTSATLTVSSLANARNVIPNLEVPQMDLGVQVTINWKQSTTAHVPLY